MASLTDQIMFHITKFTLNDRIYPIECTFIRIEGVAQTTTGGQSSGTMIRKRTVLINFMSGWLQLQGTGQGRPFTIQSYMCSKILIFVTLIYFHHVCFFRNLCTFEIHLLFDKDGEVSNKHQRRLDTLSKETRAPRGTDRSPEYNEHFC